MNGHQATKLSDDYAYLLSALSITREGYDNLVLGYDEVNRMLYGMVEKPEKFYTKSNIRPMS